MSDSLRDQLIAAGFEAPKKPDNKARKNNKNNNAKTSKTGPSKSRPGKKRAAKKKAASSKTQSQESAEAILERKKLKAQIKELIDNNKLENWKGEITYRYTVEKRIRELFVNEATHKQLTDREVAITRLNGDTFLVPQSIASDVVKINPQWSVFNTEQDKDTPAPEDDGYSDFQVPDDLKW